MKIRALGLVAIAAAAFSAFAQTTSLNPTVKLLQKPQSPVPAECLTDASQEALPALEPEQPAPEQALNNVPPSNDLRASLRRLQVAAEGDDYTAFKAAYAEARRAIAAHPAGGERNAANEALQVFTDLGRVWDYVMASPTGSFFDATIQGGSLLAALRRYPAYAQTIADQTIITGGRTLYPTRETRTFLARESSRRLSRLGISTPTKVAQGRQPEPPPRRVTPVPAPQPPPPQKKPAQVAAKTPKPKVAAKIAGPATAPKPRPATTKHKPVEKTAEVKIPKKPIIESPPMVKSKPVVTPPVKSKPVVTPPVKVAEAKPIPMPPPIVTTTTAPPAKPVPTTTTIAPPPATTTTAPPPTTTTAAPPTTTTATTTTAAPATDTSVSASTTSSTDTTVTATSDTAATATVPPAGKQNGNMNLILAVVLILVGIGVLVILFRASD